MEFMPNFQLHRPETIEEALQARIDNDEALYVAGGTDMLVNVRRGIEQPKNLVDLSAISGMKNYSRAGLLAPLTPRVERKNQLEWLKAAHMASRDKRLKPW